MGAMNSARKSIANFIPLNSVLYPDPSSDSASIWSKGVLLISAVAAAINTKNPNGITTMNQISWLFAMWVIANEPDISNTLVMPRAIGIS